MSAHPRGLDLTWWMWLLVLGGLGLWYYAWISLARDIERGPKRRDEEESGS